MLTGPDLPLSAAELTRHRFCLHGADVELQCAVPSLRREIRSFCGPFVAEQQIDGPSPFTGSVEPYNHATVVRRLSRRATLIAQTREFAEIYRDGDRFWIVDDRWGVCEIDLLKGRWQSWIIAAPALEPYPCLEMAVLWPLAQLLRGRGIYLAPAASLVRDGCGLLMISPFNVRDELALMLECGYRLIGQRWTALREAEDSVTLLHLPGKVEQPAAPRPTEPDHNPEAWFELGGGRPSANASSAECRFVLLAEHGRRPRAHLRDLEGPQAAKVLRRSWPIPDLHPQRRHSAIAARLSATSRCCEIQFSRNPRDFVALLQAMTLSAAA